MVPIIVENASSSFEAKRWSVTGDFTSYIIGKGIDSFPGRVPADAKMSPTYFCQSTEKFL